MSLKSKSLMLLNTALGRLLPDSLYLKLKFRLLLGYSLNLDAPGTFNEKLQWLKLYDRNPLYHALVDKYDVKKYVAGLIGEEYLVPTIGCWDKPEDVPWNELPERFVIKCTHDSGSTIVCTDKATFDREGAVKKLESCIERDYYSIDREWVYKGLKRRIIVEEYLGENLPDYKFFCFNGRPEFMYVASDRAKGQENLTFDFFDMDKNHLDFRQGHSNASIVPALPENFDEMKVLASRLSTGIPHVRVDFYDCNGRIYFGEYTFYHVGGIVPFDPQIMDVELGALIDLPDIEK